jgi:MFS family permease
MQQLELIPVPPPPPTPTKPPSPPHTHQLTIIITSLYLGTFLVALDTTILGTILPAITSNFHALDHLAWYGSAYLLALTALQPLCGKVYKVFDVKLVYLGSLGVFEGMYIRQCFTSMEVEMQIQIRANKMLVGSTLCAAAPSSTLFILGRAVAGIGAAGLMQGSFAVIVKTVPLSRRPFFFGLFVSAFGASIGIGPVLGGLLADRGVWRWCFWM